MRGCEEDVKKYDLLLKGGRVIDPSQNLDGERDVAFAGGRVAAVEHKIPLANVGTVCDVSGRLVVPGLIDLHTHVYWGGTALGVDAEAMARRSGTTTFVDAGSAGAGNFLGFKHHVIDRIAVRILSYLNISFAGIYGLSKTVNVGECADPRLLDPNACLNVARQHPEDIRGIKFRTGRVAGGNSGMTPMILATEVADQLGLPVMAHIDIPPPAVTEVFSNLRPGDIFTHCFKPFPSAPIDGIGRIRDEVLAARERGVYFDIGHGRGAFTFDVARVMLEHGFYPDVISSDIHIMSVDGPAFDLLVTMSKMLCLGMDLCEIVRAATETPAKILNRPDLGTLAPGATGDAAVIDLREGKHDYVDARGNTMIGDERLFATAVVIGGALWHEATD